MHEYATLISSVQLENRQLQFFGCRMFRVHIVLVWLSSCRTICLSQIYLINYVNVLNE